ncbi:OmpP1/FadL family transporter [Pelagibaculum spongiae]|uniref:Aromatic hydrocarbon degradation protein n=1 Tax=Pelagibaculum spongiae TaxID=2080658 RepID=A0A2V1GZN9_9GAMM|nr:outer membrane protein transport protein [Pelagibaculum spongiae]PVZ68253.1 hypothetical protein DC094_13225 [Pelagibaculum spongiae]
MQKSTMQSVFGLAVISCYSSFYTIQAHAAALATPSTSVSALSSANSNAIAADDPSAQFTNPALLTRFSRTQIAGAMLMADASVSFSNGTSEGKSTTIVGYGNDGSGATEIQGGSAGDPVKLSPIPQIYLAHQLSEQLYLGFALDLPYAIQGKFKDDWIGRYDGIESQVLALNFNPSIAWKFNQKWSVGFGVSAQYLSVKDRHAIDHLAGVDYLASSIGRDIKAISASGIAAGYGCSSLTVNDSFTSDFAMEGCRNSDGASTAYQKVSNAIDAITGSFHDSLDGLLAENKPENDGEIDVTGNDLAFGYNLGVTWQPANDYRFGLAYRSKIVHDVKGESDWTVSDNARSAQHLPIDALISILPKELTSTLPKNLYGDSLYQLLNDILYVDSDADFTVTTPATASLNGFARLSPKLSVTTDLTWTEWSSMQQIVVDYDSPLQNTVNPLYLKNAWRLSLGSSYQFSNALTFRAGYAFDQTPVVNEHRTTNLPGTDRQVFSFGGNYLLGKNESIDLGFSYISFKDAEVNSSSYAGQNQPTPSLSISESLAGIEVNGVDLGQMLANMPGVGAIPAYNNNNHTTRGKFQSKAWLFGIQYNRKF